MTKHVGAFPEIVQSKKKTCTCMKRKVPEGNSANDRVGGRGVSLDKRDLEKLICLNRKLIKLIETCFNDVGGLACLSQQS